MPYSIAVVFAISIIPFVADFALVASYPSYMNETPAVKSSFFAIMGDTLNAMKELLQDPMRWKPLLSSSSFQAVFTTLKHYIQPILVINGATMLSQWGVEDEQQRQLHTKILLGALYAIFYLCSAVGTHNAHKLKCLFHSDKMAMDILFNVLLAVVIAIGTSLYFQTVVLSIPLYLILYVVQNLWKPWSLAAVSDLMGKQRRATVLSVDSLLETVMEFLLAPIVGFIAHSFSVEAVFLTMGGVFLLFNNLLLAGKRDARAEAELENS